MNRVSLWLSNRVLYKGIRESLETIDSKLSFETKDVIDLINRLLANDLTDFNRRLHEYPIRANFRNYDELMTYLDELLIIISNGTFKSSKIKYSGSRVIRIDDFFTDDLDNLVNVPAGIKEINYILKDINNRLEHITEVKKEYYSRCLYPIAYTVLNIVSSLTGYVYDKK